MSERLTDYEITEKLIQKLHAGISRRDWHEAETAANQIRDHLWRLQFAPITPPKP